MVREKRYVREISPFLQGVMVQTIQDFYGALKTRDASRAWESLRFLYSLVPSEVKERTVEYLNKLLPYIHEDDPRVPEHIDVVDELHDIVLDVCNEIMAQYGKRRSVKQAECTEYALAIYNIVFENLMKAIHDNQLFVSFKTVLTGGDVY